jgi:hypothetical protein
VSQPAHCEILPFLELLTEFAQRRAAFEEAAKGEKSGAVKAPSGR